MNKKGQFEDGLEVVVAVIAVIIGVLIIYFAQSAHTLTIDNAQKELSSDLTEINSYDSKFASTDLLNLMKYQITEEYTFGEIMANIPYDDKIPEEFSNIFEEEDYYTKEGFNCNIDFYNQIKSYYSSVYMINFSVITIRAYDNVTKEILFQCPMEWRSDFSAAKSSGNITIPSINPDKNIVVWLGVF